MTNNAADNDNGIALTPISVPDSATRDRAKRRRKILAGVVAAVVVVGGITAWVVSANSGDSKPTKHTAVIPKAFGAYTEAKDGDTEWTALSSVNTDISKGEVNLTYRAAGGRAAMVVVSLDPPNFTTDEGTNEGPGSDSMTSSLLGTDGSEKITGYPAGKLGGTIQCADVTGAGRTITRCAWQSKAATVTLAPVLNHHTLVDHNAAGVLRDFLNTLKIEPKSK
ncbi:hypothetical protein SAMN05216223_104362 [Actinacidiphila yanglinensis]|uniref:Uncharacterized protein n=1 Tax=Actinacidiphila yanglinensis TaxID=310779 RepID=A0A1H5Z800_9ACTN|nr:hypothetical protein [Actinacidiphila yanglinensis]SEG32481.1 hypothetical protein SAMN05216223_104362 [Actinacidiphila yanglinensis]